VSYNTLLVSQMAKRSDAEENADLHLRVINGDDDARTRMIEGNMPLVVSKVESLVAKYPALAYLHDDLVSAGFVRLVEAVNGIVGLPDTDSQMVAGYLGRAINNAIADEIESVSTVRVARRSLKRIKSKGNTPPATMTMEYEAIQDESGAIDVFEMQDMVEACCENDDERTLIAMRVAGHTAEEIAARLGISRATIYRMLRDVQARYEAKRRELQ